MRAPHLSTARRRLTAARPLPRAFATDVKTRDGTAAAAAMNGGGCAGAGRAARLYPAGGRAFRRAELLQRRADLLRCALLLGVLAALLMGAVTSLLVRLPHR